MRDVEHMKKALTQMNKQLYAVMTVAAIDRLIHHASIIKLEGGSYRRRQQMNEKKEKKNRQR